MNLHHSKIARTIAFIACVSFSTASFADGDCSSDVSSIQDAMRTQTINGMESTASSNFSTRPGTFSSIACLDKFMQGNMDIMFRPPALNDLLNMALNFACQKATSALTTALSGGSSNMNLSSIIGSLGGGLNSPTASLTNLLSSSSSSSNATGFSTLFK